MKQDTDEEGDLTSQKQSQHVKLDSERNSQVEFELNDTQQTEHMPTLKSDDESKPQQSRESSAKKQSDHGN